MVIIDKLKKMETKLEENKRMDEEMREKEKAAQEEMETKKRREEIRKKQEEILNILNSEDPELDIPYPYMERHEINLISGRVYEKVVEWTPHGTPYNRTVIRRPGEVTGSKNNILVSGGVVTKREMLLKQLLECDTGRILHGAYKIEEKSGDGEEEVIEVAILDKNEAESYLELLPENIREEIKEEIELKSRKIEMIKNTQDKEMNKKGFLSRYACRGGAIKTNVTLKTTFGRALLAFGEYSIEKFFCDENLFKIVLERTNPDIREDILATNNIKNITLSSIKKAIKNRMRGER